MWSSSNTFPLQNQRHKRNMVNRWKGNEKANSVETPRKKKKWHFKYPTHLQSLSTAAPLNQPWTSQTLSPSLLYPTPSIAFSSSLAQTYTPPRPLPGLFSVSAVFLISRDLSVVVACLPVLSVGRQLGLVGRVAAGDDVRAVMENQSCHCFQRSYACLS